MSWGSKTHHRGPRGFLVCSLRSDIPTQPSTQRNRLPPLLASLVCYSRKLTILPPPCREGRFEAQCWGGESVGGGALEEEVGGVGWIKGPGRWGDASSPGWTSSGRADGQRGMPLSYPWSPMMHFGLHVNQRTHACAQTVRYVNTSTVRGGSRWVRGLAPCPGFFLVKIVCACEIGASSSSKMYKGNLQTTDLSG